MSDRSLSKKCQDESENFDEADGWTQECLEYLFNNKIWLPDFVRSESCRTIINCFNFSYSSGI